MLNSKVGENDLDQYVEFSFFHQKSDWYKPSDWHTYTEIAAKQCELKDFCFTETDEECKDDDRKNYFNAWAGLSLLCIDKSDPNFSDDMKLLGDPGTMLSDKVII